MTEIFSKIEKIEEVQAEMSGELLKVRKDVTMIVEMVGDMIEKVRHSNEVMSGVSQDIDSRLGHVNCGIDNIMDKLNDSEKNCTIARSGDVQVLQVSKSAGPGCSDGNYINLLNPKNASKFRFFCRHVSVQKLFL